MRVIVFLADGFEECEALIVVDILRRAGIEVIMVSTKRKLEVISSRNIIVRADALIENVNYESANMIFLPGGRMGTENLFKSNIVLEQSKSFAQNKYVAAICAAPSILSSLGLIDGKRATCHPDFEERMGRAIVTKESVTVDGNIITGQGLGSAFPFAFELVKILVDETKVQQIKKEICY